ncbi:ribosome hibernation-promoting factor, HPF/YfiA family [Petrotoga sp. 9PWA.NaAc.5.4]|uniref:ribosome hibernation-promoting factor, HPF/YfiA family n=1 Tax=Petrotoga sp. 9PWA.NaAc.5.4 TaxID=1434328 RepID=UPI000CAFE7B8|nr:ribosome-associated translation inhibitor RaiA [Petrotoga sp. 9PWA.NaAc.5.4]PNR94612.1 30S ribosomal protein S30 [Petrotoga sp. 9PWA.NaAc.5.4]
MEYKVFTKSVDLTDALKNYLEKRMTKPDHLLKRHRDLVSAADVRITKERGIYKVEITTHVKGLNKIIKVEERNNDLYQAIDEATDSLERRIRKIKNRVQESYKSENISVTKVPVENMEKKILENSIYEEVTDVEEEKLSAPKIVRTKNYDLTIMNVEEAMLQMQLLGHSFFVFRNSENNAVCVLYERKDGDLGLIEFNE